MGTNIHQAYSWDNHMIYCQPKVQTALCNGKIFTKPFDKDWGTPIKHYGLQSCHLYRPHLSLSGKQMAQQPIQQQAVSSTDPAHHTRRHSISISGTDIERSASIQGPDVDSADIYLTPCRPD